MKSKGIFLSLLVGIPAAAFASCATIPEGATAGKPFEKARYLGKWYEIARIDFKYEKDLGNSTAEYSLNGNGAIKVDNKGFNTRTGEWKRAVGKVKFVGDEDIAMLKVSFRALIFGSALARLRPDRP
jgi:apolipoprotein D and lipocalin family protein